MSPAAADILEGMPGPKDLHRAERDGTTWICAGSTVLFCYPAGDAGMRNVAVSVLRQPGFGGRVVAAVTGLTGNYVATLHSRAPREGAAGLVRAPGRPAKLAGAAKAKAERWRAEGAPDAEIARRPGVHHSAAGRRPGPAAGQEQLPLAAVPPGLARARYDDLAPLTVTSAALALGVSSAEGTRHLARGHAGVIAGTAALPEPRAPRPRLAVIADGRDPIAPQRQLAAAMLAAGAPALHVCYVDDHFVPREGARPVPEGWNARRRTAWPSPCRRPSPSCGRSPGRTRRPCPASTAAAPSPPSSGPAGQPRRTGSPGGAARSPPAPPRRAGTGPPAATAGPPRSPASPARR